VSQEERPAFWEVIVSVVKSKKFYMNICPILTASLVYWSEFLATDPEVPGSIHGATGFSEK
jgi:hypothetical protein